IADWSEADIANYLETGFTPDFDTVGGAMVDVQRNTAVLTPEDRSAIAAYLKAVPPHPNGYPARKKPSS
ncbi:MAG: cytochrome c, partial [Mesorhizobium sp.]